MKDPQDAVNELEHEALFDTANLCPKHTGLPFVWISSGGGSRLDIRVKVSQGPKALPSDMASVAIRPAVRVVQGTLTGNEPDLLTKWIDLDYDVLPRYRDGEIDTKDAIDAIRPV